MLPLYSSAFLQQRKAMVLDTNTEISEVYKID